MTPGGSGTTRTVAAAQLVAGALLVIRGPQCWRTITGAAPGRDEAAASRVVGGRYLTQGVSQLLRPTRLMRTWTIVDLLHAATMALLAHHPGLVRRAALLSGTVAAINGGLGWTRIRRHSRTTETQRV